VSFGAQLTEAAIAEHAVVSYTRQSGPATLVVSCGQLSFGAQLTEAAVAGTLWFLTPVYQGLQH
jgi:hypothetical protein